MCIPLPEPKPRDYRSIGGVLLIFEVHLQDCVPFSGDLAKSVPAAVGKADPHGTKERNIILVRAEVVESSC
jgi:hypothetical protein